MSKNLENMYLFLVIDTDDSLNTSSYIVESINEYDAWDKFGHACFPFLLVDLCYDRETVNAMLDPIEFKVECIKLSDCKNLSNNE